MRVTQLSCQEKYKLHNITIIRIAEFINTVVGTRKTNNNNKGAVVMKLDVKHTVPVLYLPNIKGLHMEILADIIHSGALRHLDYIYTDYHPWLDNDHKKFQ